MARHPVEQKPHLEDMTLVLHQSTKDALNSAAKRFSRNGKTKVTTIINLILSNTVNQNIFYLQLQKYGPGDITKLHIQVPSEVKNKIQDHADAFGITANRFTETLLRNVLAQLQE